MSSATSTRIFDLTITKIEKITTDSVVLSFAIPTDLKDSFTYKAGQYLTLQFTINGKEERRAYSLCSSPAIDQELKVAVKRVQGGLVSNYINDNLNIGDTVQVLEPQGHFTVKPKISNEKNYFLFCAGSGITPMLSILQTIIEEEPKSSVYLYYGNRNKEQIMFRETLEKIEQRYKGQLHIIHTLSAPQANKSGLLGLFSRKATTWNGEIGRISEKGVKRVVQSALFANRPASYYVCGPEAMMLLVEDTLKSLDVSAKDINIEWFTSKSTDTNAASASAGSNSMKVQLDGNWIDLELKEEESILDALIRTNQDPPYSCKNGVCSSCMCRTVKGKVTPLKEYLSLSEDDIEEGYFLSCCAVPESAETEVSYDI